MPETTMFGGEGSSLQPNTILLTRYKIEKNIGGGGQGAVYVARDLNFPDARRLVAVKEMLVNASDVGLRTDAMKTFQREANILATLSHPAIPKIYDFFDQNNRAYVVMEYINGKNLEEILNLSKNLPIDRIIGWAIDLCDVLSYLHDHKPQPIIFRDMKPANIMIDSLAKVRLVDFGIAKIFVQGDKKGTMIGTEGYSAPEQYRGKANPLSDIYSLGATLHHVLTRKDPRLSVPFSFAERPITQINTEASSELASIVEKALEYEPQNRYQSLEEMKAALESLRYRPINVGAPAAAPTNGNGTATEEEGTGYFEGGFDGSIQAKWVFETEDEIRSSPTAYKDMAFVGSYDNNVWAVNLETGKHMWKRATQGGIATTPMIDGEHRQILVGSEDHSFNAFDYRDGSLNWSHSTSDKIRSSGRLAHGYVFFGSDDGKLYAIVSNNGRYMWEFDAGSPIRNHPFVTNDRIIFGTDAGEVFALELNGKQKWSFRARRTIESSPIVDKYDVCYVGSYDNYLYAIDAKSGYSQWRFRTQGAIISTASVQGDNVYIASTDGRVYCVNAQNGKEIWHFDTGEPIVSSPCVHQGAVYIGGTDNKLYALDARNGSKLWEFEAGAAITSTPYIAGDLILFGCLDHKLYALPLVAHT